MLTRMSADRVSVVGATVSTGREVLTASALSVSTPVPQAQNALTTMSASRMECAPMASAST